MLTTFKQRTVDKISMLFVSWVKVDGVFSEVSGNLLPSLILKRVGEIGIKGVDKYL